MTRFVSLKTYSCKGSTFSHPLQWLYIEKERQGQLLPKMCRNGNPYMLLVGMQNVIFVNSLAVHQNVMQNSLYDSEIPLLGGI
jgi:hypothetical protein